MSSQVKRGGKVWKAVVGVISTVIIVGLFVALLVLTASGRWVDSVSSDSASVSHAVSQRRITAYCPSRMTLPDASAYGDSEYQPSEGDISSSAGFAAFGAVYRSQFGAFGGSGDTTQLKDLDPTDTAKVIAASADVDRTSLLFDTQLLESAAGVGASASVASWAIRATCAACPRHPAMSVRWSSRSCCLTRRPAPPSSWSWPIRLRRPLWWMFGCGVRNSPVRWRCPREAR